LAKSLAAPFVPEKTKEKIEASRHHTTTSSARGEEFAAPHLEQRRIRTIIEEID